MEEIYLSLDNAEEIEKSREEEEEKQAEEKEKMLTENCNGKPKERSLDFDASKERNKSRKSFFGNLFPDILKQEMLLANERKIMEKAGKSPGERNKHSLKGISPENLCSFLFSTAF
jgi:hypothetical protein